MEGKKISFGFMKTLKVEKLPVQEKKDFIECVEENSIRVVGGDVIKEIDPLVIPMKPNTLITTERLQQIAEKVESALTEPESVEAPSKPQEIVPENETLDQMAVRELLEDSKKDVKVETQQLTLIMPTKSVPSGEKESTLDDYESVPVQEFGLAMLRGMGWKKTSEKNSFKLPQLRPKGLGLGADKVVKDKHDATKYSNNAELTIEKSAYVKIITGKYSGYYGKVLSLDEDNNRVVVDITVKNETVSLSEFMMHPVTQDTYNRKCTKILDSKSLERYNKNEEQKSKNSETESSASRSDEKPKHESNTTNSNLRKTKSDQQSEERDGREKYRDRSNREKHRDSSDDKYSKKNKRDNNQESLSDSESGKKYSKKQNDSMESDTERRNKKKEKRYDSDTEPNQSKKYSEERRKDDSDSESEKRIKTKEQKRQDSDNHGRYRRDGERRRHDSDLESGRKGKKSEKERKSNSSESESDQRKIKSDTPEGKRDIDKKRKGKKKKRDRDRSPNYRKHRK